MPKRTLEIRRKTGWRMDEARGGDGDMDQPVGRGLQVSLPETSVMRQAREKGSVLEVLLAPKSEVLVVSREEASVRAERVDVTELL